MEGSAGSQLLEYGSGASHQQAPAEDHLHTPPHANADLGDHPGQLSQRCLGTLSQHGCGCGRSQLITVAATEVRGLCLTAAYEVVPPC